MKFVKKAARKILGLLMNAYLVVPILLALLLKAVRKKKDYHPETNFLARRFASLFSRFTGCYCMIEMLPKKAQDVRACTLHTDTKDKEYAVVIQGPVLDGFTAESIRVYRKILPKAYIIVSTWKGTDDKLAEELRGLADEVILNELPKTNGLLNINYQAKSSYEGMKRACELEIPYAFKMRSDLRVYTPLLFEYMKSLLEAFPIDASVSHLQKERIIASPSITPTRRAYWLQDFFYFGTTQDLLNFFDFPPDTRHYNCTSSELHMYRNSFKKWDGLISIPPEVWLTKSYIQRFSSGECKSTIKNFWEDIQKRFLMVNTSELGMYWNKYNYYVNLWDVSRFFGEKHGEMRYTSQLTIPLIMKHICYDSKLEEANKYIELFQNLGTFCNGYEYLDAVMKDIPFLRGEETL